jgi:hypothetical protein
MALARVVTFEGVGRERIDELDREMREGESPEGFPASELVDVGGEVIDEVVFREPGEALLVDVEGVRGPGSAGPRF